ncbi:MAG: hypothetical protein K2G07_04240, partial [Muribaculaceae bacterium]|nr:hypothetical protein [Muribaculaceae bacterium]
MTLSRYIAIILLACVPAFCSTDAAAADSRLAQGKWVKVKVDTEGIQQITHEQLRSWGFKKPEYVTVYG